MTTRIPACKMWAATPSSTILNLDDVHVWRIPLAVPQRVVAGLIHLLSNKEKTRAQRMLGETTYRRFVVSHGALRKILSRYLSREPERIRFVTDAQGKPRLSARKDNPAICFSLSHSQELALCAVTRDRAIGIDLERIRPLSAWREVAARYFSRHENKALETLSHEQALLAFYRVWTRKEACAKALGWGVSQQWTQLSVSLKPGAETEILSAELEAWSADPLTLRPIDPGSGYVAAVAVQGARWRLSCWQWHWVETGPSGDRGSR